MRVKLSFNLYNSLLSCKRGLAILFSDLLPANLTLMLPSAISWGLQRLSGRITMISKINLFTHSTRISNKALLVLHGDHAHPFSTLHLAKIGEEENYRVFSLHLNYDLVHPEFHRKKLHKSISKIQKFMQKNGNPLSHLVVAGHSRGASEAVIADNSLVNKIIGIAGRYPSSTKLNIPFYQIAAKNDWCIPLNESIVQKDQPHLVVDSSHLSVLNQKETLAFFRQALRD